MPEGTIILSEISGATLSESLKAELYKQGLEICSDSEMDAAVQVEGLLVAGPTNDQVEAAIRQSEAGDVPRLLLVYGDKIRAGLADALSDAHPGWEVIRMFSFANEDKVLLGGEPNGKWLRKLSVQLARRNFTSLVCRRCEVDEAVRQLGLYLTWKERFFMRMGEECDKGGSRMRLQVIARALGMDKRIGQGWLYPERKSHTPLYRWLDREFRHVLNKTNVHRITLWGSISFWRQMPAAGMFGKEVRLVSPEADHTMVESLPASWSVHEDWRSALAKSDLLMIGTADPVIREMPLPELVGRMAQPIVIDACSCFPIEEAESCQIIYRAIGENTNVWEWSRL
ncbi:hypothetical protein [Brevibacillus borstelensis]|uniref:hypothetical protein n=1 Tax=Brevibacillus borstelensis TaxID=45462 RepID=UPI0030BD461F